MSNICWDVFSKDALPQALFGESNAHLYGRPGFSQSELAGGHVAIGFFGDNKNGGYNPPSVVVVSEKSAADIFSWLKVYAPETSPLSQFARVITDTDWEIFRPRFETNSNKGSRPDAWACVVLGELLAHGESEADITTIPLSRSLACFTTTVARTAIIHRHPEATRIAVERLRKLEVDSRFSRRSVTVEDLTPAWAIVGTQDDTPVPVSEVAELVLHATQTYARQAGKEAPIPSLTDNFPGLTSSSVEKRVLEFQRVATAMAGFAKSEPHNLLTNVTVAAAAFLVGRGTTHAFLLRRWSRAFPLAFLWFGVMAALAGARQWDASWSRAVKGIEKTLRATLSWTDPPAADLCWTEFSWLANTFEGAEVFAEIPKMVARVLSVEVAPGAACQLKLESMASKPGDADHSRVPVSQREQELQSALTQLYDIVTKTRHLLEPKSASIYGNQGSLTLEGETEEKACKKRRPKRT